MKAALILLALLSPSKDAPTSHNYTPVPKVEVAGRASQCTTICQWFAGQYTCETRCN